MDARTRTGRAGVARPSRLVAASAATALVMLWASGAEAVTRPIADAPRAPGIETTDGGPRTAATGFPTVRHGHTRGTMLAV